MPLVAAGVARALRRGACWRCELGCALPGGICAALGGNPAFWQEHCCARPRDERGASQHEVHGYAREGRDLRSFAQGSRRAARRERCVSRYRHRRAHSRGEGDGVGRSFWHAFERPCLLRSQRAGHDAASVLVCGGASRVCEMGRASGGGLPLRRRARGVSQRRREVAGLERARARGKGDRFR